MLPLYTSTPTSRGILNILSLDYNTQSTMFPATLFRTFAPFFFFFIPLTSTSSPHSPTSGNPSAGPKRPSVPPSLSLSLSLISLLLHSSSRNSCGYLALANGYCCCPCSCSCLSHLTLRGRLLAFRIN